MSHPNLNQPGAEVLLRQRMQRLVLTAELAAIGLERVLAAARPGDVNLREYRALARIAGDLREAAEHAAQQSQPRDGLG